MTWTRLAVLTSAIQTLTPTGAARHRCWPILGCRCSPRQPPSTSRHCSINCPWSIWRRARVVETKDPAHGHSHWPTHFARLTRRRDNDNEAGPMRRWRCSRFNPGQRLLVSQCKGGLWPTTTELLRLLAPDQRRKDRARPAHSQPAVRSKTAHPIRTHPRRPRPLSE
jgi:hypothetical protein